MRKIVAAKYPEQGKYYDPISLPLFYDTLQHKLIVKTLDTPAEKKNSPNWPLFSLDKHEGEKSGQSPRNKCVYWFIMLENVSLETGC